MRNGKWLISGRIVEGQWTLVWYKQRFYIVLKSGREIWTDEDEPSAKNLKFIREDTKSK